MALALIAAAVGAPASKSAGWNWSDEPFTAGFFGDYAGQIAIKARDVDMLPQLAAREFAATLNFGKQEFSLDDMTGDVAGGRLTGNVSFHAAEDGLHARAKFALAGADMSALLSAGARPPITGRLALSGEAEGAGLSPVALIGSLQGSGNFTLSDAQFAGLDPRAFEGVIHAVDQGLAIEPARISDIVGKALQSGSLAVKRAQGDFAISAGQVRLGKFSAEGSEGAIVRSPAASILPAARSMAGWCCRERAKPGRGQISSLRLKGPLTAPERTHRRLGADRLAHVAGDRKPVEETARHRAGAAAVSPLPRPKSESATTAARPPIGRSSTSTREE